MFNKEIFNGDYCREEENLVKRKNEEIMTEIESPYDYLERKRKVDLSNLVYRIIEDELSPMQQDVIKRVKFGGENAEVIAHEYSVDVSAVYKTLSRSVKHIRNSLKYVIYYQRNCFEKTISSLEMEKILVLTSFKYFSPCSIAHRLRKLAAEKNFTLEDIVNCIDIDLCKLRLIFNGQALPDCRELVKLSALFETTSDYILKGDCN